MDIVQYWNEVALEANRTAHTLAHREPGVSEQLGLPLSARALAIVQLAVYDALASLDVARLRPYLPFPPRAQHDAQEDGVVSGAAQRALIALYPSQRETFAAALAGIPVTLAEADLQHGARVAERILRTRDRDATADDVEYSAPAHRHGYRADPRQPEQRCHAPHYGRDTGCFAAKTRHRVAEPPLPGTREYLRALRQVQAVGICAEQTGKVLPRERRSGLQCLISTFWGYYGSPKIGTLPRVLNRVVRQLAVQRVHPATHEPLSRRQVAELLALTNVAMADAAILAFEQKYAHAFWRPVTAIREADQALGPQAIAHDYIDGACDPEWLPAGVVASHTRARWTTPNSPAYPSARAAIGAAALHSARLYFGVQLGHRGEDNLFEELSLCSEEHDGNTVDEYGTVRPRHLRRFSGGLWQMIDEIAAAGVYRGIAWPFDRYHAERPRGASAAADMAAGAVELGLAVAEDIAYSGLIPPTQRHRP